MVSKRQYWETRRLLVAQILVFSGLTISSLIELVKHHGSLTIFHKVEDGLVVLLTPSLIWNKGNKLFRHSPERSL